MEFGNMLPATNRFKTRGTVQPPYKGSIYKGICSIPGFLCGGIRIAWCTLIAGRG